MNVAIIGGGVGGLLSALYLSNQGVEVTIYEKEEKLGGRLAFIERDGYRIDRGPTIVLLPELFQKLLDEAGIDRGSYELLRCDPLYSMRFPDGVNYTKYADEQQQLEELQRVFPFEVEGFKRFMKEGRYRFELGMQSFLEKDFVNRKDFWTAGNLKTLLKLKPYQTIQKLLSRYFKDERLQTAYALQSLYIGGNPFQTPGMYSLISFAEHEHGVYYLKGGYASLIPVLENELDRRNVMVHLNSEVTKIHTNHQVITGIETKRGIKDYDAIIFNGDFPSASKLLGETSKRSFVPSSGCVLLYFGLNRIYKEGNVHQYFIGQSFVQHMKDVFERKMIPEDPAFYAFHPSIIDDSLAPAGKGVLYALIPVPSDTNIDWKNETEWIEQVINRMENLAFSGLREAIEWMEVRTPMEDIASGLYKGGSFGIAPTLSQSGVFRPQVKPYPFENLYAVGASIHPGGGIPLVMQGAKLLVDQFLADQARKGVNVHV